MSQGTTEHVQTGMTEDRRCREKAIWGNCRAAETFADDQLREWRKGILPLPSEKEKEKKKFKTLKLHHIKLNSKVISISIIRKLKNNTNTSMLIMTSQ